MLSSIHWVSSKVSPKDKEGLLYLFSIIHVTYWLPNKLKKSLACLLILSTLNSHIMYSPNLFISKLGINWCIHFHYYEVHDNSYISYYDYISFLVHFPTLHLSLIIASFDAYLWTFWNKWTKIKKDSETPCYMVKHFMRFIRGKVFMETVFVDNIILLQSWLLIL